MPHFATAALIRKRSVEKRSENHTEKTSEIHGEVMEIHLIFCIRFGSHFAWILKVFSLCFSLRFSAVRFRKRAVVAHCGMPEYYGFYNGF